MPKKHNGKIVEDIQKYFLLGALVLLIVTLFFFVSDFLGTLFVAAVMVSIIYPLHRLLNKRIHIPQTISALVTLILIAVLIIAPLTLFFFAIVEQATGAYLSVSEYINQLIASDFDIFPILSKYPQVHKWAEELMALNPISPQDLFSTIGDFVGSITTILVEQTTNILKQATVIILHAIIFILALYFFVRDGKKIVDYTKSIVPLSEKYREELFVKIKNLMHAIVFGIFGAALVQGFLVWLAFTIVGIDSPAFWGALAGMFSPVPYVGPAIIWLPVAIMLLISGNLIAGIFLLIWGIVVVGLSDNIVKPLVIGTSTSLHPFAVLVVILGGVFAFGFKGIIFGPLILTLTLAFLHIYKMEYAGVLVPVKKVVKAKKPRKKIRKAKK